jgi:murein DD-endopeptidase MepM/ murein hydrolase activator NlpD
VRALGDLDVVQRRRAALDGRVAALDAQMAAVQARAAAAQREADLLTVAAVTLDGRAERTAKRLRVARADYTESTGELYRSGADAAAAYVGLSFEATNVTDITAGSVYLEHVTKTRKANVDRLSGLRSRTATLRLAAERKRAQVVAQRKAAEREQQTLRQLRAQQAVQRDALRRQEAREQTIVARIRSRKSQYNAELAALQVTSVQIRSLLYDIQSGEPRASSFHCERPVPGYVTSGFGTRYHPVLHTYRTHTGVDFHAGYGEPIHAAASGRVVWAGPRGGYGNAVVIDHGGQFATLYGHSSALYVNVGDHVDAGDTIAAVGATGMATGPHLHFEVRILGQPVDPMDYL